MTSPSESFKRKLLEPIEEIFKEALDSHSPPPAAGGRNWQLPTSDSFPSDDVNPTKRKLIKSSKSAPGKVDEAALQEALYAVNGLIGLNSAKRSIQRLANFARIESERRRLKLPQSEVTSHSVFTGSPGTGKTSLARLLGKILHALGLLQRGHTVEVDKSGLVAEYLGQTPMKVEAAFDRADGGVLFVDEAYSLTHDNEDLYGKEAVDMILKLMEDRRDRVVVVVAGYQKEMRQFIQSNPGLRSRFNRTIRFDDFDAAELLSIQKQMVRRMGFEASDGFNLRSELMWQRLYEDNLTTDANGRMVRSALEVMLENQAGRLVCKSENERHELCELLPNDLDGVEQQLRENHED